MKDKDTLFFVYEDGKIECTLFVYVLLKLLCRVCN